MNRGYSGGDGVVDVWQWCGEGGAAGGRWSSCQVEMERRLWAWSGAGPLRWNGSVVSKPAGSVAGRPLPLLLRWAVLSGGMGNDVDRGCGSVAMGRDVDGGPALDGVDTDERGNGGNGDGGEGGGDGMGEPDGCCGLLVLSRRESPLAAVVKEMERW